MPINVMIVDDSAVIRGLVARTLEQDPEIEVVASAANGQIAVAELERKKDKIDVIILDIEMPIMDGMQALPLLLRAKPTVRIIMASTLTTRNADISLRALRLGAVDYIGKPSTSEGPQAAQEFRAALLEKIKALFPPGRGARPGLSGPGAGRPRIGTAAEGRTLGAQSLSAGPITLRKSATQERIRALAIASSTGGPQALFQVMESLKTSLSGMPVFITQHMPKKFTTLLASHISKISPLRCIEGEHNMRVQNGMIYLAPGDFHMRVKSLGGRNTILLDQGPPINFCRPAADPMITSLAEIYGRGLLVAVLTGMGSDGLDGCRIAVERGGTVIAQDEKSSIVWGMPGAVARAGLCTQVLPLGEIPSFIRSRI